MFDFVIINQNLFYQTVPCCRHCKSNTNSARGCQIKEFFL